MDESNDMDLVRKYAATESDDIFAEIVRRQVNLVYSAAMRRLGNPHQAEEVTQAVFIILARKAGSLRPGTILSGWLYQTAQLTAANYQRSVLRRQRREQEALMQFVEESEAEDSWKRLQPLLEDAMAALGAKERDALVLRYFENRPVSEVAAALHVNEAAAQKRVNRATEKLRKFFVRRGAPVSAGVLAVAIGTNSIQAAPAGLAASVAGAAAFKGATAGVSTITLIQGTLKIMAWSKVKTSVIACAAILLIGGGSVATVQLIKHARASRSPALQGAWEGTVDAFVPDTFPADQRPKLRLVLHISKTNGAYAARMDSIDQGATDLVVDKIAYEYPQFSLEMNGIGAVFKAKLNATGTEMSGTWSQFGGTKPFTMKRTANPDTVLEPLTATDCTRRKDSDLQGIWKSELKISGQTFPIELRIVEPANGTFRAEGVSAATGGRTPATAVTYERPSLTLELAGVGATFDGQVSSDDMSISGTLRMAGESTPVKFERVDTATREKRELDKDFSHNGADDLPGHWAGVLNIQGTKLRLKFDIAKFPDGKFDCSVTSVDQGNAVIPASDVKYTAPKVQIACSGIGGSFSGELKGGKISGKWAQGGMNLPLVLERSSK